MKEKNLKQLKQNVYEMKEVRVIEKKEKSFYFCIKNKKIKITKISIKEKVSIKRIHFTVKNIIDNLIYYFKKLKVKDLKLIIDAYNELVPERKKIFIYDIYKLDKSQIYFLFFIMYNHEKLTNFQTYFKDNALLFMKNYDDFEDKFSIDFDGKGSYQLYKLLKGDDIFVSAFSLNMEKTKLHQILGISKQLLTFFKTEKMLNSLNSVNISEYRRIEKTLGKYTIHYLKRLDRTGYGFFIFKELLEEKKSISYHPSELISYFEKQKKKTNVQRVSLLFYQLNDYIKMCEKLNFDIEKFPKDLEKAHWDLTDYYNLYYFNDEYVTKNESKFKRVTSKYNLEYRNDDYTLCKPTSIVDVYNEGKDLNHCVFSYMDEILDNDTHIYFLRDNQSLDVPLITVEYDNHENRLIQASGNYNRELTKEEQEFLNEWKKTFKIK